MTGVWAKDKREIKNSSIAFIKYFDKSVSGTLSIAGGSCYQIFCDSKMIGFGPSRTAHKFSRVSTYTIKDVKNLVIIMAGYNIKTFWLIDELPFFYCTLELSLNGQAVNLNHNDFTCCELSDKKVKVQRYSFQRAFIESYNFDNKRAKLLGGKCEYPILDTEVFEINTLIPSVTSLPLLSMHTDFDVIENGFIGINPNAKVWRDRAHTEMGDECYNIKEWVDFSTDEASRFTYSLTKSNNFADGNYLIYDFKRAITGFLSLNISVKTSATVYVLYDELIWDEEKNPLYQQTKNVSFYRNTCSNVLKWELSVGEHDLLTLEPYSMRYVKVVVLGDAQVEKIGIIDFENPDSKRFEFSIDDADAQAIMRAAVDTFSQNAVDLLTDCPSRERAGWLSDSYFSSVAERLFTGKNTVEESFLQNYALFCDSSIPRGMIPMCYPADNFDGTFIPNWSMWYILEVYKNWKTTGSDKILLEAQKNIFGIYDYFCTLINEIGMLENLKSWVFVEWSEANDHDHIVGVNVPSNMCWASCLNAMGEMYQRNDLIKMADRLKSNILELAFDGEFFVDNLVRREGKLIRTTFKTEVCQYYAFWFGIANKIEHAKLYNELMDNMGVNRKDGYRSDVGKPNAMYGIYMRLDLLERENKQQLLYRECKSYFSKMAERTGTLWEHNDICASTIHGFASYAAKWLTYCLTGYLDGKFSDNFIGTSCSFYLPKENGGIKIIIKDGTRTIFDAPEIID